MLPTPHGWHLERHACRSGAGESFLRKKLVAGAPPLASCHHRPGGIKTCMAGINRRQNVAGGAGEMLVPCALARGVSSSARSKIITGESRAEGNKENGFRPPQREGSGRQNAHLATAKENKALPINHLRAARHRRGRRRKEEGAGKAGRRFLWRYGDERACELSDGNQRARR